MQPRRWSWARSAWSLRGSAGPASAVPDAGRPHEVSCLIRPAIRRVGAGLGAPFGPPGRAIERGAAPVRMPGVRPAREPHAVEPGPDASSCRSRSWRLHVIPEQPSARGGIFPGEARAPHEDDAGHGDAVIAAWSATPGLRSLEWQQWRQGRSEILGNRGLAHSRSTLRRRSCQMLLGTGAASGRTGSGRLCRLAARGLNGRAERRPADLPARVRWIRGSRG